MASRKEEKERRRQERLETERALAEQERRRRLYAVGTGGLLALAAVAAIVVVVVAGGGGTDGGGSSKVKGITPPAQRVDNLTEAAKAANCKLSNPPIEGREHVTTPVKYKTNPPTSGNHNPIPAEDGAYDQAPKTTALVHSLEHGRIIYQYDPSIPKRRIRQLKGLFDQDPYHTILVPNDKMPYQVAVTAWGHLAGCKRVTDESFDVFRAFRGRYLDKGPEFVP